MRSVCSARPGAVCAGAWAPLGAISEGRGGAGNAQWRGGDFWGCGRDWGGGGGEVGGRVGKPAEPGSASGGAGGCRRVQCVQVQTIRSTRSHESASLQDTH